eukprot:GHVQ01022264.1.p1 GENE.GHVQ01022264.1~~GHVQ01022264.1.p1  ORF type:complete len:467 (-),score=84.18 GHVQ01022264.1:1436-2836(-)
MAPKKKAQPVQPETTPSHEEDPEGEAPRRQLQLEAKQLQEQYTSERRLYNEMFADRERLHYLWIIQRQKLQDLKAKLRNKERDFEDIEEKQHIELKLYKQRLKHLRYHQQDELVNFKSQAEIALKLQEDDHRTQDQQLQNDQRTLKVQTREIAYAHDAFVTMLKLRQGQVKVELRQQFERDGKDLQQLYKLKMHNLREKMEAQRKANIAKIEEAKNQHVAKVQRQNLNSFQSIKHYYGGITSSNLDIIKRLKEEHEELKQAETKDSKVMTDLVAKNRALSDPLKKAHQDVDRLTGELQVYEQDKKKLLHAKEHIREEEAQFSTVQMQSEILTQQLAKAQQERDSLYKTFQQTMYRAQQKTGLKNLFLEKKLDAMEEVLEISDAQIAELQVAANIQPPTANGNSKKLQEVLEYKDSLLQELEKERSNTKASLSEAVTQYEARLKENNVPIAELGFMPSVKAYEPTIN